tara:strand:- start:126 stop:572 length:447 start_codon:yes stop_codon:yes gene_type:complete
MNTDFQVGEIEIVWKRKAKTKDYVIDSSTSAVKILRPHFQDCMEYREKFGALYLNQANKVLGFHEISRGGTSSTTVDVRHIAQGALELNASAVILCHNHPSGSLNISQPDRKITDKVKNGLNLLDIRTLDHIILTEYSYLSMMDENEL